MKRPILSMVILAISIIIVPCSAQQEAQYTQYMYNTMAINPAYSGSRVSASLNALYRSQWTGVDGAPKTQTFSGSFPTSERVALGFNLINDEIGNATYQDTYFSGVFAYSIPFEDKGRISFGLSAGGSLLDIDYNNLRRLSSSVSADLVNIDRKFSPNFGVGVYYNTQKFYLGLSSPGILETQHFDVNDSDGEGSFVSTKRMHMYLMSGYVFELTPRMLLKPAALLRSVTGSPMSLDVSANLLFLEQFRLGASYRVGSTVSALLGFDINRSILLGFAYDYETTTLGNTIGNTGSIEVIMRYRFSAKRKFVSPEFF